MSMISSLFSPPNLYEAVDRASLAQTTDAIGGTKQAFAETDEEASSGGRRQGRDPGEASPETEADKTAANSTDHQHVLDVTA